MNLRFYIQSSIFLFLFIQFYRQRYLKNQIYTWVGSNKSILVSINPFQQLPLYSPEIIQEHAHPPPNKQLSPHVYDIAYSAYSELCYNHTNQSILISGESGAGKTEATKQCLGFIAEVRFLFIFYSIDCWF